MKGLVAEIALQGATFAFDKLYTYAIPPELHSSAKAGCRALVPFGKGNIKKQGMIFSVKQAEIKDLKSLLSIIDSEPVLTEELLGMCEHLHESVFCTYYDAVHTMLPAGIGYKLVDFYSANEEFADISLLNETEREVYLYLKKFGEKAEGALKSELCVEKDLLLAMAEKQALIKNSDAKRKIGDATQKWVRLAEEDIALKLTQKQTEIVNLLKEAGAASVKEICYFTGISASVIEGLIKKGIVIPFEKKVFRAPYKYSTGKREEIILTDEQQAAYDSMVADYNGKKASVSLLYGITGSGKTQVFLRLADYVVDTGRGVIVMVPEIALTPQLISIFTARYGGKIAIFHSAMSLGQRMDEWQRVRDGKAVIAIGTRSAIFAPFKDLGLIIIDEEQEHTYKSEKTPRFHTRDLAKYRAAYHSAVLCLASATPSVESYTQALKGKYSLLKLTKRYGSALLPTVETVDMKQELLSGNKGVISNTLYEAIRDTLSNNRQAILLLNRRGHNTYVSCPSCGYVAACPNCSVSLTYHSANERLMCHYCGYSDKAQRICPECGNEHMRFMGLGTQKAEEELKALFPEAKVLRVDADSTMTRDSYSTYLNDFAKGEYNILLGTQMVAKGLDFPNVTLVGVLGADSAMYSEDYRSFERTFALLTQVVGRAGRGDNHGRAIIQTSGQDSDIIELAENQDYNSFYNQEILTRKLMIYPPYCDICMVTAQSAVKQRAQNAVNAVFEKIKELIGGDYKDIKLIILGPSPAAVSRVNNRYRYRMIIKCRNNTRMREMLRKAIAIKTEGDATVSVDINPETII